MKYDPTYVSRREKLSKWFNDQKPSLDIKHQADLYFSEHACERIIDRKLEKDKHFIVGMSKWFMSNIFYQTTYNSRSYQLQLRGLKCVFFISPGEVAGTRFVVLKTVFESSEDYECDEKINLK